MPEIAKLSGQMNDTLRGKIIRDIILLQEKCCNISGEELRKKTKGAEVTGVYYKGKWIFTSLGSGGHILLSLGMGADVLYFRDEKDEQEKYQVKVLFTDGSGYTARFWWFGKFLFASGDELASEPNTKDISIDPFDSKFTSEYFNELLKGKKTQIKAFLMNQKNVGGIGNMYMHDILCKARLHPMTKASDLSVEEKRRLYDSIIELMNFSREKGSFSYEKDFFGEKGGFGTEDFLVGYKENKPCPVCGEMIVSVKAGGSSAFICPGCQQLK